MAFPTIPTVASGDLLSSTTSPASTTHTFPNLSSLRGGAGPQTGDLLIAICVQYGAATAGNQYSSWGASFTEMLDDSLSSGTGVGALGIAYKSASGSESGAFTVTSAQAFKSVQFLMRIPAVEWRGSGSPPEVQAATRATGAAADPGVFNPSWAAEDTLLISVAGQTETSTTGSPPAISAPPSNYSGELIVARIADAVGDITAAVAFRQLNADSDDVGLWTGSNFNRGNGIATVIAVRPAPATLYGQIAFPITFGKAVSGIIEPQETSVAEISLASHGEPSERTSHSIKVRARTTSGSTGILHVALYEGETNRSGDLSTTALSNTLTDYTLAIADANADNITDYSNLSLRIWGEAPNGGSLVFEVADIYLELPEAGAQYGAVSQVITFSEVVSGFKETFGQVAVPFTFGASVSGDILAPKQTSVAEISLASHGTPSERTNHSIKIRARTTSGSTGVIRAALYEGETNRSGDLSSSVLTNSLADYTLTIPNADAETITDYSDLSIRFWGYDSAGEALVFEVADVYLELPEAGAATYYGIVSSPFTFVKDINGQRTTFSQIAAPFTFVKAVNGVRTTFGQIVTILTFVEAITGIRTAFGQIVAPFTFIKDVVGQKTTFGQIVAPFTFVKDIIGQRTTFGQIAFPFTFVKEVSGRLVTFGAISQSITFSRDVSGKLGTFGQISTSLIFEKSVSATKQTFAQIVSPFTFVKEVTGYKTTFGQIAAPFTFVKNVIGQRETFGQISASFVLARAVGGISIFINRISAVFTFNENVSGIRETFSQISSPFIFTKVVSGTKQTFGQIVAPFIFVKEVNGKLEAFSQITAPFTFGKSVSGFKQTFAQVSTPFVFGKDVAGYKTTFGQIAMTITTTITTVGYRTVTQFYGAISSSFIFTKDVIGQRTTFGQIETSLVFSRFVDGIRESFGQIVAPFTFVKDVVAQKTTFGQIVAPFTFVKDIAGVRTALGQISALFTFNKAVSGQRTTFSRIDLPLILTNQTNGRKETFGTLEFPINIVFNIVAETQGIRFGQTSMSLVFDRNVAGVKETFGQVISPYIFNRSIQALRTTFGQISFPFEFIKETIGRRETFSSLEFPINASILVAGRRLSYGQVELSLVLGEQTIGQRETFGQVIAPYNFDSELTGVLEAFSSIDFPVDFVVDVNTGRVEAFSSLGREFLLSFETAGIIRPDYIILNLAKAIYLGSTSVDAIYTNSQKVWPK